MKAILLTCDEPSQYTGRIYTRSEVEKMVEDYQKRILNFELGYGDLKGELRKQSHSLEYAGISISEISHKVDNLYIDAAGNLVVDYHFVDNDNGKLARDLLERDIVRLSPVMNGIIPNDGMVNNDMICHDLTLVVTSFIYNNEEDNNETER